MALSPATVTMNRSAQQQFAISIGSVAYTNVVWSVSPNIGSIDANGLYTAPDFLGSDVTLTLRATSTDDNTKSVTGTITVAAVPPPIRVRAGSVYGLTDGQGNYWAPDYGYTGGGQSGGSIFTIANTTPDLYPLYSTAHYGYPNTTFSYDFPLPNGAYEVTLKFADFFYSTGGNYAFDVKINGVTELQNFDPDAVYNATRTAVDRKFIVFVTGKSLEIDFVAHDKFSFVNAIQILPSSAFSRALIGRTSIRAAR
jgi:hypothetical protein